MLGAPREANYEAVPRVVFTDPQAASVGAAEAFSEIYISALKALRGAITSASRVSRSRLGAP